MQRVIWGGTRIFAALLLLASAACGHKAEAPPPVAPVVALPVHPDGGSGGSGSIRYPVEVTARYSNTMSFRVPGKLIKRNVRLGDSVKQGQVLAQLDPVDAQKQLASAKASLDAAEHRLVYARQQLDRDQAQSQANLIAANQLEQTQDSYTAALAGRDQAAAQLVVARNNLEYNTLIADHDGLITSENADTGQVVAAGQAVYGLAWNGDTDVILDAAESYLGRISIGQTAKITFPALPGRQYEARVREIAPAADPQSRTFRVKLQMTGPVDSVRLGMTGDAMLIPAAATAASTPSTAAPTDAAAAAALIAAKARAVKANTSTAAPTTAGAAAARATNANAGAPAATAAGTNSAPAFTLPATAIFHQDNHPAVWIVSGNDSTLQLRAVQVSSYTDHSSVVTAGLQEGDVVVLAGVHTVYAGQHVRPVRPLFDGEGNIDGPAPATPAPAASATAAATGHAPVPSPPTASRPAPAAAAATTGHSAPPSPAGPVPRPTTRVAATHSPTGAQ